MTKDHDFKKLVRARMARTGERYAAARAQLARKPAAVGVHPESAALVSLLAAAGVAGPGGGAPSEALVLGLGGGLGAACFTFEYAGHTPTFYVATRCQPQYAYDERFVRTAAERLGARCELATASSAAVAHKKLAARVALGPVMTWLSFGELPWAPRLGPVGELGAMPHVVVVEAITGDVATLRDLAPAAFEVELAVLARARARLRAARFRTLVVAAGGDAPDPRDAVRDAIAACVAELGGASRVRGPMAKNFGLPGLARWAAALDGRDKKKPWTRVFPPAHAAHALAWTRHWIELASTGGGGFRPLYADFLDEAAAILRRPALRSVARDYRALGAAWSGLATAALPDHIAPFAAVRRAQDTRHAASRRGDLAAMRRLRDAFDPELRCAPRRGRAPRRPRRRPRRAAARRGGARGALRLFGGAGHRPRRRRGGVRRAARRRYLMSPP